ncbi:MAG: hypothetical protein ACXVCY_11770 [Pseudobdellovibrionaceae bacterium]
MADLHNIGLFCFLYSGVVMSALWLTVTGRPTKAEVRAKKSFK